MGFRPRRSALMPKVDSQAASPLASSRSNGDGRTLVAGRTTRDRHRDEKMPGSVTSVISEAEDFEAALHEESVLGLLVTGHAHFRARQTQVALHRLRLAAGDEHRSR